MKKRRIKFFDRLRSSIPPHLTPEERAEWEKQLEWEKQELARRKKEGFWKYPKSL